MAQPDRFPSLALPFAIVGACAGWLSAGLLANPILYMTKPGKQPIAAFVAMALTAAAGVLIRRWCIPKRYAYELDVPAPDARPPTDSWARHVITVLVTGTLTGTLIAVACDTYRGPLGGAASGLACAVAFVPVCAAVIVTARRAQRARLGSIVAASDRGAVWVILMTALAAATLEALPDWPAALAGERDLPTPALYMTLYCGVVLLAAVADDLLALRRARRALGQGLVERDPSELGSVEPGVPRVDLGLGDGAHAKVTRSAAAYRGRDRTLALVQGSPEQALSALRAGLRRTGIGLAVVAMALFAHLAAQTRLVQIAYANQRCGDADLDACARACEAGSDLACQTLPDGSPGPVVEALR